MPSPSFTRVRLARINHSYNTYTYVNIITQCVDERVIVAGSENDFTPFSYPRSRCHLHLKQRCAFSNQAAISRPSRSMRESCSLISDLYTVFLFFFIEIYGETSKRDLSHSRRDLVTPEYTGNDGWSSVVLYSIDKTL